MHPMPHISTSAMPATPATTSRAPYPYLATPVVSLRSSIPPCLYVLPPAACLQTSLLREHLSYFHVTRSATPLQSPKAPYFYVCMLVAYLHTSMPPCIHVSRPLYAHATPPLYLHKETRSMLTPMPRTRKIWDESSYTMLFITLFVY